MFAKTFRNTLIASTLVIAGAALATPAYAQLQTSDTVQLSGPVVSTTSIDATAVAGVADNLDLGGEGTATAGVVREVARLDILSNNTAGVTVTATASGPLSAGGSDNVPYEVRIAAEGATLAASDFTTTIDSEVIIRETGGLENGAATRGLFITYDAPSMLGMGTYVSSILVEIADVN